MRLRYFSDQLMVLVLEDVPIAKEMLRTCATFEPIVIPNFPGSSKRAFAMVLCLTSTPLGTPVLPEDRVN
jgi:hypothetical protein